MSRKMRETIDERSVGELCVGYLRYEALRKLNPRQFTELHRLNLSGARFDDMVDELIERTLAQPGMNTGMGSVPLMAEDVGSNPTGAT